MSATTIKVPRELRDRLAALAKAEATTMAGAIEKALEAQADAAFWADVARTMPTSHGSLEGQASAFDRTLTDGLDPDEDWGDVW
jgi:predicted DNA-binding protein